MDGAAAPEDTACSTSVRLGVVAYAIVTAGVYDLLLRGVPTRGTRASSG